MKTSKKAIVADLEADLRSWQAIFDAAGHPEHYYYGRREYVRGMLDGLLTALSYYGWPIEGEFTWIEARRGVV
ncbi:MAG TPA: hypothetical protein VEG38_21075 [Acidimicrobiia bacterium]|nr:hypothetical protein [Acidimicrobiia bacterium]